MSGPESDLGAKRPYEPERARARAGEHGRHFARRPRGHRPRRNAMRARPSSRRRSTPNCSGTGGSRGRSSSARPTGPSQARPRCAAATASCHLAEHPPRSALRLAAGSWGADGDWSMWLNPETEWTWRRLWPLESAFWDVAPRRAGGSRPAADPGPGRARPAAGPVLRLAVHHLDRRRRRLRRSAGSPNTAMNSTSCSPRCRRRTAEGSRRPSASPKHSRARDSLFPDVLPAVEQALRGSRAF